MILLAFLVDASFMVGGSCLTKVFLVPDPLVEPVDLHGTPALFKASSTRPREVLWLRDVPPPVAYLVLTLVITFSAQAPRGQNQKANRQIEKLNSK